MFNTKLIAAFIVAILSSAMFFTRLHKPAMRQWDEAGYALNAFEMLHNKQWFMVTFKNQPDLYNSKPPGGLWPMVLSIKLFGFNEFAVRFPSAFLAVLTCMLVYFVGSIHSTHLGLIAALILCSSIGYTGWHEARSGDFDVPVCFYIFLYVMAFWYWITYYKNYALWLFSGALLMACLTKGVYGLLGLPGLFIFLVHQKKLLYCLKKPIVYVFSTIPLLLFVAYYWYREQLAPGYLRAVLQNEIGERVFLETNIHKQHLPFYYHAYKLIWFRYQPYILFVPLAVWLLFKQKQNPLFWLCFWCATAIFLIVSFSTTKLVWYDGSLYPFFSFLVALGLINFIKNRVNIGILIAATYLFCFWLNQTEQDAFDMPQLLQQVRANNIKEPITVYGNSFVLPSMFYATKDSLAGNTLHVATHVNEIKTPLVIVHQTADLQTINTIFTTKTITKHGNALLLQVQAP
jgi:4-amino-4-deoxy-L-arabinose transferase-like glycosyltransferase